MSGVDGVRYVGVEGGEQRVEVLWRVASLRDQFEGLPVSKIASKAAERWDFLTLDAATADEVVSPGPGCRNSTSVSCDGTGPRTPALPWPLADALR